MTTPAGIQYGSGFRYGVVYQLNANGRLKGSSAATPYSGQPFVGHRAWNLQIPQQRRIFHINADRVGAADFLPPTETARATINVDADNQVLDAILTGNKQVAIGTAQTIADLTSNQGFEPIIALLLYQQSIDAATGLRAWRSYLIPRAKAIPMLSGFADREVPGSYDVMMTPTSTNIFGAALTALTDGATDAQLFRAMTAGRPAIMAWKADGYTQDFTFPAGFTPAVSTSSITVWSDGTKLSAGFTLTTSGVHFSVAPAADTDINIFWEF